MSRSFVAVNPHRKKYSLQGTASNCQMAVFTPVQPGNLCTSVERHTPFLVSTITAVMILPSLLV